MALNRGLNADARQALDLGGASLFSPRPPGQGHT
jgi:hypothetical protein